MKPNINLFWIGIVLYMGSYTFTLVPSPIFILTDILRVLGILCMVVSSFGLMRYRFENTYLKVMFTFYICWLLVVVLRGIELDYETIKYNLFTPFGGVFLYLTPLILLVAKPPFFYRSLFKAIAFMGVLYLIFTLVTLSPLLDRDLTEARGMLEISVKLLAWPCAFLLVTFPYQNNRKIWVAALVIVVTLLLSTYRARRGLFFITGSSLVFASYIFLLLNKRSLISIALVIIMGGLFSIYGLDLITQKNIGLFERAIERMDEDTRSGVEDFFYADMEFKDWIVGRGMNGTVAAPVGLDSPDSEQREGIETDYLNIILKGGVISLALSLLIAVPALFLGLFQSKNLFCKAAALWILLWLVSLYPSTVTSFSLFYLLVWISVGICYSKKMRSLTDRELALLLK